MGKTWWDWLELCLVPIMLAGLAVVFGWWQIRRERHAQVRCAEAGRVVQEQRAEVDGAAQELRARDAALQAYLDRTSELLKRGLRESAPEDAKRVVARARTLTALRQLDGERKGLLLLFLFEAGLIGGLPEVGQQRKQPVVDLHGASLQGAHLRGANLQQADLQGADLRGADLREANLRWADLRGADLRGADLREADLGGSDLQGASLRGANVQGADVQEANLRRTDLQGANLKGASLRWASLQAADLRAAGLQDANLRWASLREAKMQEADLQGADLRATDLEGAEVTEEQWAQASSIGGATLPGGTVVGDAAA